MQAEGDLHHKGAADSTKKPAGTPSRQPGRQKRPPTQHRETGENIHRPAQTKTTGQNRVKNLDQLTNQILASVLNGASYRFMARIILWKTVFSTFNQKSLKEYTKKNR